MHFNQPELKLLRRNCTNCRECTFWSSIMSARAAVTWQSSAALPSLGEMRMLLTAASQRCPRTRGKNGSVFTSLTCWMAALLRRNAPGSQLQNDTAAVWTNSGVRRLSLQLLCLSGLPHFILRARKSISQELAASFRSAQRELRHE